MENSPGNARRDAAAIESAHLLEALFEQSPISMQLIDAGGQTIRVNRAWERVWGAGQERDIKALVKSPGYNILTDPQLHEKGVTPYLRRAFAGESVTVPTILYDPAELGMPGEARWVGSTVHPIKDDAGHVRQIVIMHQDRTAEVKVDRELRQAEEQLRFALDSASMVAWGADLDTGRSWRSHTASMVMGLPPEGPVEEFFGLVHPDDREWLRADIERAMRGEIDYAFEYRMVLDGNRTIWLRDVGHSRVDPVSGKRTFAGVAMDITARRTGEERLRLATDAGQIGIWDYDVLADQIIWSDQAFRIHGIALGGFGGKMEAFIALVHPDDRQGLLDTVHTAMQSEAGFRLRFRIVRPDGTIRWVSNHAELVRNSEREVVRIIGTIIDVTAQVQYELKLKEGDRRKDEFLATLAHELRNPLAPIMSAAEIMERSPVDANQARQLSQIISRQARHLTRLVDDLLDVSRVTRGLVTVDRRQHDLKAIAYVAIEQVRPLIETKRHHLTVDLTREVVRVNGDEKRLVQVIANLLNNAAKYTPSGGNIHLAMEVEEAHVLVHVEDDGMGIPVYLQERIFELFEQADSRGQQGGLGIGLALVRSLVELHGGQIACHSGGEDKGSRFTVRLPRLHDTAQVPSAHQDALPFQKAHHALTVMVVDDNVDGAQMLAMFLEASGHNVHACHTADAALDLIATVRPDVCVLDIGLPDMDGYMLCSQIRQRMGDRPGVMVALTGYAQSEDAEKSQLVGFDHHLTKPANMDQLLKLLDPGRH